MSPDVEQLVGPPLSRRAALGLGAAAGLAAVVGPLGATASQARRAPASAPLALVYRGPASLPGCPEAVVRAFAARGRVRTAYVGPGETLPLTAQTLAGAAIYVQPGGGSLAPAWREMRPSAPVITDWVRGGGRYLGLCLGAYLAADDPGFGLFPGQIWDYQSLPRADVRDRRAHAIRVRWRGRTARVYVQDPTVFRPNPDSGTTVMARYRNGRPAALSVGAGRGRLVLVGPHPEARRSWYRADRLRPPRHWDPRPWRDLERMLLA